MKWIGRQSGNVEDRRGMGGGTILGGGIGAAVIGLIIYLLGGDPSQIIGQGDGQPMSQEEMQAQDSSVQFVKYVAAYTEDVWTEQFSQMGKTYTPPKIVIYNGGTQTGCGGGSAASGPFYCPIDQQVYLDLSFYDELRERFGVSGDFAMAYVIAHEVGHHIQKLLGISDQVQEARARGGQRQSNALSVKLELQADFLAGVWAHHAQKMRDILDPGDIEEALNAANAIGDDRLQKEAQGTVVPESFTHGTSAQRMYWFKKGFDTGDINQGDTFAAEDL
jgi:uncharacterized protein